MPLTKTVRSLRAALYTFSVLYGLVSITLYLLPFIFLGYVSSFQMGLVAWTSIITGLLVAAIVAITVTSHTVFSRRHHAADRVFQSEEGAERFLDQTVTRVCFVLAIAVVVCGVLSLAGIGMELYNLIGTLVRCPVALPACANTTLNATAMRAESMTNALVRQGYALQNVPTLPVSTASLSGVADPVFLQLMLYTMCSAEYGFLVFLTVFLFVVALLDMALMIYFLRLRYVMRKK